MPIEVRFSVSFMMIVAILSFLADYLIDIKYGLSIEVQRVAFTDFSVGEVNIP